MNTILITGGSEGIGFELARIYASRGEKLILVARNEEKLRQAAERLKAEFHADVLCASTDLAKTGNAKKLYHALQKQGIEIDVLINNAGSGYAGVSWEIDSDKEEAMAVLNMITLMTLSKLALKDMTRRHHGTILNIGSTAAFQPGPYMAGYYASKAFVLNYTEAIALEAKNTGVNVKCYCPGQVNTAFFDKAGNQRTSIIMSPEKAASEAVRMLDEKATVYVSGTINRLILLIPRNMRTKMISFLKRND